MTSDAPRSSTDSYIQRSNSSRSRRLSQSHRNSADHLLRQLMASHGTPGYAWPRSPPLAPDTSSPIYPDRPIRPLPKRRIRDRLSAESAASFSSPPRAPSSALFTFPYVNVEREVETRYEEYAVRERHTCSSCADHEDSDIESEDEHTYDGSCSLAGRHHRTGRETISGLRINPPPAPDSTTSSADGYESFENTNNKKKRKIPQSSGMLGSAYHSTGMPGMSPVNGLDPDLESTSPLLGSSSVGSYYGSGSAVLPSQSPGTGISGPGRGRYGKPRPTYDRRPLGVSSNGLNAASFGRTRAHTQPGAKGSVGQQQGIISQAIANAAQHGTSPAAKDGDNISLLKQQANKTPPPKTEFTFQPDSGKQLSWPGPQSVDPLMYANGQQRGPIPSNHNYTSDMHAQSGAPQHPPSLQPGQLPQQPRPRKPRSRARMYEIAARQRKIQQEYQNYHHPPRREDVWICEFCEYEDIFGVPPSALIRLYEKKDRAEQKRLAEKRRLLEKAKMKGRKNKKGSKGGNKTNAVTQQQQSQQQAAPVHIQHDGVGEQYDPPGDLDYGDEEYYEDDYDDQELSRANSVSQPGHYHDAGPPSLIGDHAGHHGEAATRANGYPDGTASLGTLHDR